MDSSLDLLKRAQQGDAGALEQLCRRYRPHLRDWARSRLPRGARSLQETEDLVQETLLKTLSRLEDFEPRHEGALLAYMRQALLNRIRDEIRRAQRHPDMVQLDGHHAARAPSPLQEVLGLETLEIYESALQQLTPEERQGIVARVELGRTSHEIAELLGRPSADAARVFVARALLKLAKEMNARLQSST